MNVLTCLRGLFVISRKKTKISYALKLLSSQALITLTFLLLPYPVRAGVFDLSSYHTYGPLTTRTQNPLYLLFLSGTLEKASTLPKRQFSLNLETSFSNLFEFDPQPVGVGVDLDMELTRTTFKASYGFSNRMEAGLEIPFLSFSAGFLDEFIQDYHSAFGFPNGGRDQVDNNRFSYRITQNRNVLYQVDQSSFGLSDLVLWQKINILDKSPWLPAISAKSSLKLPTGSAASGTGSNRPDFGFTLLAEKSYKRFHSYTQLGFVMLGGHPQLNPILKKGSATLGQAIEFNITEHLSLIGQLTGNTTLFKNVRISELSRGILDLTFGLRGEIPLKKRIRKIAYQFAFTEDPRADDASVDFSLFFKVGVEY